MEPQFSFVIPCFQSEKTILRTLDSIFIQIGNFEVIVVDNGPSDELRKLVEGRPVRFLETSKRGASVARNHGARAALGQFIIFVDSDVVLPNDWLTGLSTILNQKSWIDVVAGAVEPEKLRSNLLYRFRLQHIIEKTQGKMHYLARTPSPLVNTALCAVRRTKFNLLGGFDESLMRLEDNDFTTRAIIKCLHMTSYSRRAKVIFADDSIPSYLKRSVKMGYWYSIYRAKYKLGRTIWPKQVAVRSHFHDPLVEALRILNEFAFNLGSAFAFIFYRHQSRIPDQPRFNFKNPFYFHFKHQDVVYRLTGDAAILSYEDGMTIFYEEKLVTLSPQEGELFLSTFRGDKEFDQLPAIVEGWIRERIFLSSTSSSSNF